MAVTRRQFVAGMSALAASMGFNSAQIAKITEALAAPKGLYAGGKKPKVIWVHGAECTGCSVSLLSLFEDARATIDGTPHSTVAALGLAYGQAGIPRTFHNAGLNVDAPGAESTAAAGVIVNVQDVLVDWLDLQYHETVMAMGGDQAYDYLKANMEYTGGQDPFVLVVEGATQDIKKGGAWDDTGHHPWCSIGMPDDGSDDLSFDKVVEKLANRPDCAAVISIGQCASFGGFPAAISPAFIGKGDAGGNQTGAQGTFDFLSGSGAEGKVINVPGCPPNPWWFVLTVVAWLVDFQNLPTTVGGSGPLGILRRTGTGILDIAVNAAAVDSSRRLRAAYPTVLHTSACPRYPDFGKGKFAVTPGDDGCLLLMGCKGNNTKSLCFRRGWNGQQPGNVHADSIDKREMAKLGAYGTATNTRYRGGNCIVAGHPCMACTEKGYPDRYVPFVDR
jgi:hydrogenase small subunit